MALISVIVPVYNVEHYLRNCLDSIRNQTMQDIEIILVDDGSTDESGKICDEYATNDTRFIVIHIENSGVSNARNNGIKKANGKYIMMIDSDDWIEPNMCQSMYQAIENAGVDYCFCANYNESSAGSIPRNIFQNDMVFGGDEFRNEILTATLGLVGEKLKNPAKIDKLTPVWARLYKKEIIDEHQIKFIDMELLPSECLQFNFEYLLHCNSAIYINEPFYHYRRNTTGSITKGYREGLQKKWEWWSKYEKSVLEPYQDDYQLLQAYYSRACCSIIPLGGNALRLGEYRKIREETTRFLSAKFISESFDNIKFDSCPFCWRIFFFSAKKRWIDIFILLTWCMRTLLKSVKK